jgi:Flp pilus assembly pilin Flp
MVTSTYINTIWLRNKIIESVRNRVTDDHGNATIEYAFLVVLIAVACMGAVTLLGSSTSSSTSTSANSIIAAN